MARVLVAYVPVEVGLVGGADPARRGADELDATIRRSIFELRSPIGPSLRAELREAVQAATEVLGFRPYLDTSGPVDSAIPDDIRPELLAVLREAPANSPGTPTRPQPASRYAPPTAT